MSSDPSTPRRSARLRSASVSPLGHPGPMSSPNAATLQSAEQPYEDRDPIELTADLTDPESAITVTLESNVKFFFNERERDENAVTDKQDPLFRPVVPSKVTFTFNTPNNSLTDFKQLLWQAFSRTIDGLGIFDATTQPQ